MQLLSCLICSIQYCPNYLWKIQMWLSFLFLKTSCGSFPSMTEYDPALPHIKRVKTYLTSLMSVPFHLTVFPPWKPAHSSRRSLDITSAKNFFFLARINCPLTWALTSPELYTPLWRTWGGILFFLFYALNWDWTLALSDRTWQVVYAYWMKNEKKKVSKLFRS